MKAFKYVIFVFAAMLISSFFWGKHSAREEQVKFAKSFAKFQSDRVYIVKRAYDTTYQIPDWDGNGWSFQPYQLEYINPDGKPSGITIYYEDCDINQKPYKVSQKVRLIFSDELTGGNFQQNNTWSCYARAQVIFE